MSPYFEPPPHEGPLDPVAAVTACIEHGAGALLLDHGALPVAFFDLSTGVAGEVVQRLTLYEVRMAAVVPDLAAHSARFQEFAREANRGQRVRFFPARAEAVAWVEAEPAG